MLLPLVPGAAIVITGAHDDDGLGRTGGAARRRSGAHAGPRLARGRRARAIPGCSRSMRSPASPQADVIVHDALVDPRVLALAGRQARLEFAGKRGGKPSATQADISERLIALGARRGARVAAQGRRSLRVRPRRRGSR